MDEFEVVDLPVLGVSYQLGKLLHDLNGEVRSNSYMST